MSPSLRSDESKPSFYAAVPYPCENCRLTTCLSLHTYSASSCPYNLCPECRELEGLDAQIADAHNPLVKLSQKRHNLKGRINRRHDRLTSRLPLEVISHIFTFFTRESERQSSSETSYRWDPVLKLGAVCRRWRDITLGTPQLWTEVTIDPRKHSEITEQWLSRSRALPLALNVHIAHDSAGYKLPTILTNFGLLRSQASRWRDLTLYLPMGMLHDILGGLEDMVTVESLAIERGGQYEPRPASFEMDKITMKYPFVPKHFHLADVPLSVLPVHFNRLTRLTAVYIEVDDLLFIFQSARHLQRCTLEVIPEENGNYPMPLCPIANDSMKVLDTSNGEAFDDTPIYFLTHLTLPSLKVLRYRDLDNRRELDELANFVDRSQPPLIEFHLVYVDRNGALDTDWYSTLSSVTSLVLIIDYESDDDGSRTEEYIRGLSACSEPIVLPCLQKLEIRTSRMNSGAWDNLSKLFPDYKNRRETAPVVPRPLKTVSIDLNGSFDFNRKMRQDVYYRLRTARKSGVELWVFNGNDREDVFGTDREPETCPREDWSDEDSSGNETEGEGADVEGASDDEPGDVDEASSRNGTEEEGTEALVENGSEEEFDEE